MISYDQEMNGSAVLQESDLIFSSATSEIRQALTGLKRSNLSITNRLHSINKDAKFVQEVAKSYELPLVANERCGSWYIPPHLKAGSAYFKSTDGHFGQWSFSLRRLNLQILEIVGRHGGCIIVDSTRRGKSMPDALSKTIPIWLCVLNRLLFPGDRDTHSLRTPAEVVSRSEHSQIEERIPAFVEDLRALSLDLDSLRSQLHHRAMLPVWVTPADDINSPRTETQYHQVVLCTASSRASEELHASSDYVQGAADDSESWAYGLDARLFWHHQNQLLGCSEDELAELIATLVAASRGEVSVRPPVQIKPTSIWIGNNAAAETTPREWDVVVSCQSEPSKTLLSSLKDGYVHLACPSGKVGSRQLRAQLPKLDQLSALLSKGAKVLVTCPTGKDLAVGVALAIICVYAREDGRLQDVESGNARSVLNKAEIKQRLSWIMVSMPDAAPSRATLQSINSYLMG